MAVNTKAVEDYVKAIYKLAEAGEPVTTSSIADRLDVSAASVTGMLKKLEQLNLIHYEPYRSIELNAAGREIALEVIRHHRLIELFLAEALGMPWDEVHAEAERLEHVISEQLEDRIDAALGHPDFDPHGDPIPSRDGVIVERETIPLAELAPGDEAVVARVSDHDSELLRYLGDLGLYPGTRVVLLREEPFAGPLTLDVDGTERILGRHVAGYIEVVLEAAGV